MYYEMEKIHSFSSSNTNAESNSSENAEDDIQLESDNTSILVYKLVVYFCFENIYDYKFLYLISFL